jgi:hypothetical protein
MAVATLEILPDQETLMLAWRRSVASGYVASQLQSTIHEARRHAAEAPVPADLGALVAAGLVTHLTQSWDEVVQRIAKQW